MKIHLDEVIPQVKEILQNEGLLYEFLENALKDSVSFFESYCKK